MTKKEFFDQLDAAFVAGGDTEAVERSLRLTVGYEMKAIFFGSDSRSRIVGWLAEWMRRRIDALCEHSSGGGPESSRVAGQWLHGVLACVAPSLQRRCQALPTMVMLANGWIECVEMLVAQGVDLELAHETMGAGRSSSLIHWAAGNLSAANLERILDLGAFNLDRRGANGWTPAFMTLPNQRIDNLRLLRNRGANIFIPDEKGGTLLHSAIAWSVPFDTIRELLDLGFDPAARNHAGQDARIFLDFFHHNLPDRQLLADALSNP